MERGKKSETNAVKLKAPCGGRVVLKCFSKLLPIRSEETEELLFSLQNYDIYAEKTGAAWICLKFELNFGFSLFNGQHLILIKGL